MESKKLTLGANSMIYGVILGAALIIFDLLFYIFDAPVNSPYKYFNMLIIIAFIVYGTITYRNKYNNGFLKYGRSFLSCFLIALYAGILFAVYYYLFVKFFDHSIIVKLRDAAQLKLEDMKLSEEQVEKAMIWQRRMISPGVISIMSILGYAFWGAILSLIVSIFIKKEDKSFEAAMSND